MSTARELNIAEIPDRCPVSGFQWMIFTLCALCLIMDGFDVQAMGYVAPALVHEWHIPTSVLGPVFSAALAGILIGSLLFSTIADRVGRRPVLIGGAFYFAVLTLLTAGAQSIHELLIIRFFAGLGLGGMMPNAMALVGEYSPKRIRVAAMMAASCGFTAGAALGGFLSAWLIPVFGWRAVFLFGGSIPLVIATLMIFFLPESLTLLVVRGRDRRRVLASLRHIDPQLTIDGNDRFVVPEENREGTPAIHLFRDGRSVVTLLLWVVNFMNLLNLYFLSNWIPTITHDAGYSTRIAVLVGAAVQAGGTVGALGNSWLIGRFGFVPALGVAFAVGCVSIGFIGQPFLSLSLLFVSVFIAGWCVVGGQPGINALAAVYYPTYLRSTGIGWGLGVGRLGAIAGPLLGGVLIAHHWATRDVFLAAAVPAAISAAATFALRSAMRESAS
jgi:MFS transporter, AAHS family, 4-hydroxybenzoate transporter